MQTPTERTVRLAGPAPVVGAPVRIGMSGVEIEARITKIAGNAMHVKVKATQLRAHPKRRTRTA